MGLRQCFSPSRSQTTSTRWSSPTHETETRHDPSQDPSQDDEKKERKNLFESGQCGKAVSRHDQDRLFLPQPSHVAFLDQYHSPPYQQGSLMVQIEDHSAPFVILHHDGKAVTRDDPTVVQDPRTVEMGQRAIDQNEKREGGIGRMAHCLAIGQLAVAATTGVR